MAGKSNLIICDTDVLIEAFRNNIAVIQELDRIGYNNISISVITFAELLAGARNKTEFAIIAKKISTIPILEITSHISELFHQLIFKYSLSHSTGIPDILIAATALYHNYDLYTFNKKHFNFIPGLSLHHQA